MLCYGSAMTAVVDVVCTCQLSERGHLASQWYASQTTSSNSLQPSVA